MDSKSFKEQYKVETKEEKDDLVTFIPDDVYPEITQEEFKEYAKLFKDDEANRNLIALKDPMVRQLIDYITAAIIIENKRINSARTTYPLQISRRYKALNSTKNKLKDYRSRNDGPKAITDFLAMKIIPEEEHSIFSTGGDKVLEGMRTERERLRRFLATKSKKLDDKEIMSFEEYCRECTDVIDELKEIFIQIGISSNSEDYAKNRLEYYDSLKAKLAEQLAMAKKFGMNSEKKSIDEIIDMADVKLEDLLHELENNYHNQITMYQLKKTVLNTLQNSELLKGLHVSLSTDPSRTKEKRAPSSYASDFIGFDIEIPMPNGKSIVLPIECQIQTREQNRDGDSGSAIHTENVDGKEVPLPVKPQRKLWNSVKTIGKKRYIATEKKNFATFKNFLSAIIHSTPDAVTAQSSIDDPEEERVMILPTDLYGSFKKVSRVSSKHKGYKFYLQYFRELYADRDLFLPSNAAPIYISLEDIPSQFADYKRYSSFWEKVGKSVASTFEKAYGDKSYYAETPPANPIGEEIEK